MPAEYITIRYGYAESIDFNTLRDVGRIYGLYKGKNAPLVGNYYHGVTNIGYDTMHFAQVCVSTLDTAFLSIHVREYAGEGGFQEWMRIY